MFQDWTIDAVLWRVGLLLWEGMVAARTHVLGVLLLLLRHGVHAVCVKRECRGFCPSSVPWICTNNLIWDCAEGGLFSFCIAGLGVVIAGFWRLSKVVWYIQVVGIPARVGGELLYPVVSWCDGLFWIDVQGSLRKGHGIGSAPSIRWQTRQTIVVVVEWSKLRHVSHSTLSDTYAIKGGIA